MKKVVVSWSTGKDCAWALHILRQHSDVRVVGLLTTLTETFDRVAMHAVRRELAEAQARAASLDLRPVWLPWPCTNEDYEARMAQAVMSMRSDGVTHVAFGDLFLEDVRAYRERQLFGTGLEPLFPLWGTAADTPALAKRMQLAGTKAVLTCVDPRQAPAEIAGKEWNADLLASLPPGVDPCGERGEFHSFCYDGPMFRNPVPVVVGEILSRDGFVFADVNFPSSTS